MATGPAAGPPAQVIVERREEAGAAARALVLGDDCAAAWQGHSTGTPVPRRSRSRGVRTGAPGAQVCFRSVAEFRSLWDALRKISDESLWSFARRLAVTPSAWRQVAGVGCAFSKAWTPPDRNGTYAGPRLASRARAGKAWAACLR